MTNLGVRKTGGGQGHTVEESLMSQHFSNLLLSSSNDSYVNCSLSFLWLTVGVVFSCFSSQHSYSSGTLGIKNGYLSTATYQLEEVQVSRLNCG